MREEKVRMQYPDVAVCRVQTGTGLRGGLLCCGSRGLIVNDFLKESNQIVERQYEWLSVSRSVLRE